MFHRDRIVISQLHGTGNALRSWTLTHRRYRLCGAV